MLTFSRNQLLEQPVDMKKSLIFFLAIALLISGCSTVSLVYRNADWYLQHKINGYTSFNARQKETIRRKVSDYMRWHRKNALPEYVLFLQNLNGVAQYDGQLKAEQIALLRAHLMSLYQKSLVPAISPAAQMLSSLDSRQIQELGSNLAEENQKQRQEELDASHDEYLDRRADKIISFLEWLAGNLSGEQEQKVREMSRHLPVVSHIYLQHREANQGRLLALLNGRAGTDKIAAFMSAWILAPEATRTPQQQRSIQSFETASDEMIAQIHGLLTSRQKEHIRKLISSYIEDMHKLSSDAHAASGASRQDIGPCCFAS
jgi:hypothetical protein